MARPALTATALLCLESEAIVKDYGFVYICEYCDLERPEHPQILRHVLRAHLGALATELGESIRNARRYVLAQLEGV